MNFLVMIFWIGVVALGIVGWAASINYLERHSDNFRRFMEEELSISGCKPSGERIRQQWNEVASLVDKCNNLHAIPVRSRQLWKMVKPQGTSPVQKADSSVMAESLGRFRSSLVASAEKGRRLCHRYLKGGNPSVDVISLNTLFSLIVDTCRRCSPETPCVLSELKKSSGGWQKSRVTRNNAVSERDNHEWSGVHSQTAYRRGQSR